ncbi:hypothetical protein COU54_01035 [Candidatus Pacearchaeota archaeon CG10_big_fil_rev_8_21_14_0_10_31_24]|nr:MAG: hypothetical protein COU54_01035 [Candidatus Pacearchaeota archaeon CG10_big_fil_rev_8_21_14_0_10_31_24]
MEKLYALKNDENGLYFQVSTSGEVWDFLTRIAMMLFDEGESYIIDDYYMGEIKENDQFNYSQDGIHLVIVMANGRAYVSILGIPEKLRNEIKDIVFENYAF